MKTIVTIIGLLACLLSIIPLYAGERGKELNMNQMTKEMTEKEVEGRILEEIKKVKPIEMPEYLYPSGPHMVLGNMLLWVANNSNKMEGWSLTGYSKVNLDSEYRLSRWKFGIIGGELEAMRPIHDKNLRHLYENDDLGMQYGAAIGIHFYKEF